MILVPAALSSILRSSWNLFQDCSASEVQHSHSFPIIFYFLKWSVNAVKTSVCSFQTVMSLRGSEFWLLSCLQNQTDFPSEVPGGWGFSSFSSLTLKRVVWEVCWGRNGISHCVLVTWAFCKDLHRELPVSLQHLLWCSEWALGIPQGESILWPGSSTTSNHFREFQFRDKKCRHVPFVWVGFGCLVLCGCKPDLHPRWDLSLRPAPPTPGPPCSWGLKK